MEEGSPRSFAVGPIDFDFDAYDALQDREAETLGQRLAALMANRRQIERASEKAASSAVNVQDSWGGPVIAVPSELIGREYKGEPRPLLARLLSRRSEFVLQVWSLLWLWGLNPWDQAARKVRWENVLPLGSQDADPREDAVVRPWGSGDVVAARRRTRRSALRCLDILNEEYRHYDEEMRAWRAAVSEPPKRAWVTPPRPARIEIPLSFYHQGWHLTLSKSEIAWWLAGRLTRPVQPTNRIRDRYVGFSKHVTGTAWLQVTTVLDAVHPQESAVLAMSRVLLRAMGGRHSRKDDWPRINFTEDEYPELVVRGTMLDSRHPCVLIATNLEWHLFETNVGDVHVDLLTRRPGRYPTPANSQGVRYPAYYDSVRKTFNVHPPNQKSSSTPLLSVHNVSLIAGETDLYRAI